jgi:hypothetical protein
MNQQKLYDSIIQNAKNLNRTKLSKNNTNYVYYENHHIIPKCLKGTNEKENLVLLTAKEHFVCHKLLTYIYKNNREIAHAFQYMTFSKRYGNIVSGRDYTYARELLNVIPMSIKHKEKISNAHKGKKVSEETKLKISESCKGRIVWNKGIKCSEENKENNRQKHLGKKHSQETKEKMKGRKAWNKGLSQTQEVKNKISESLKGRKSCNKGKTLSEEHRRKLSISLKGNQNAKKNIIYLEAH